MPVLILIVFSVIPISLGIILFLILRSKLNGPDLDEVLMLRKQAKINRSAGSKLAHALSRHGTLFLLLSLVSGIIYGILFWEVFPFGLVLAFLAGTYFLLLIVSLLDLKSERKITRKIFEETISKQKEFHKMLFRSTYYGVYLSAKSMISLFLKIASIKFFRRMDSVR